LQKNPLSTTQVEPKIVADRFSTVVHCLIVRRARIPSPERGAIDRAQALAFTFDGKPYSGFAA
jgi:hypothetical protein